MKIFLVQHADAVPKETDPGRPLSEKGKAQAKRAAEFLRKMPFYPEVILHSDKKRSIETAEVICFALGGVKMELRKGIAPNDDIEELRKEIMSLKKSVMIVGHQPFLGKLASALLDAGCDRQVVDLSNASPLILVNSGDGFVVDTYFKNEYIK
jgi:phosphohistidine phosphatase